MNITAFVLLWIPNVLNSSTVAAPGDFVREGDNNEKKGGVGGIEKYEETRERERTEREKERVERAREK